MMRRVDWYPTSILKGVGASLAVFIPLVLLLSRLPVGETADQLLFLGAFAVGILVATEVYDRDKARNPDQTRRSA